jgi:hypothetical protein
MPSKPTSVASATRMLARTRSTITDAARRVVRNLPDLPSTSPDRPPVIETQSQYRGNRLTHRFYPDHYARVLVARDNLTRYGGLS